MRLNLWMMALLCAALCLPGCGEETTTVKKVDKFPASVTPAELDDSKANVSIAGGFLKVGFPKDWNETLNKKKEFAIIMRPANASRNPTLAILDFSENSPFDEVTDANKQEFLDYVKKMPYFGKFKGHKIVQPHKLIKLGDRYGVLFRVNHAAKTTTEIVYLATAEKKKLYLVELRADENQSPKNWPAMVALFNSMAISDTPGGNTDNIDFSVVADSAEPSFDEDGEMPAKGAGDKSDKSSDEPSFDEGDDTPKKKTDKPGDEPKFDE
ncbi:MAG: hypothetical protein SFX18_01925 [Pirellulales bacterium]|nr:hypothetical protein [Pirellulales bacterium]